MAICIVYFTVGAVYYNNYTASFLPGFHSLFKANKHKANRQDTIIFSIKTGEKVACLKLAYRSKADQKWNGVLENE